MDFIDKLKAISANLEKCERVSQYSTDTENQCETLAHAFLDMQDAMQVIINERIPMLYLRNLNSNEVDDLILDIGEELRHILYHINDTRVYDYLKTDID
jgi:hypothetical protein